MIYKGKLGFSVNDDSMTDIEEIMKNTLDKAGIRYVSQHSTRTGYVIDFAILERKIATECDGEAWHTERRARKRDRFKDHMLKREGWKVIRFWGYDIKNAVERCILKIKQSF